MKKKFIKRPKHKPRKYFRINLRKKDEFLYFHSKTLIINKILIILIIIFLYIIFHSKNYTNSKIDSFDDKLIILESNEYKNFDEIKNKENGPQLNSIFKEIKILKHIFAKQAEYYKNNKNVIHITYSINNNNNYKYILLVSMFSVLSNCDKKTFIIFHILCTPDFNESSLEIYKSLLNKYSQNVEMIFYNMGNHFIHRISPRLSQATYYRLLTPIFINSERLIHLDGDTLTFSDLNEMYNLDFNDNYILGIYDILNDGIDYLGIKSEIYINAGVTLLNLKKLRDDKKVFEFLNLFESGKRLKNEDQTIINYLLHPKIGRLPCKFGMFNYEDDTDIKFYLEHIRTKVPFEEVKDALKNPSIIHNSICLPKPWYFNAVYQDWASACGQRHNCSCKKYVDIWHSIAKKTDYYYKILNFTKGK